MKKLFLLLTMLIVGVGSMWAYDEGDQITYSSIPLVSSATTKDGASNMTTFSVTIPASADLPAGSVVTLQSIKVGRRAATRAYLVLSESANANMASTSKTEQNTADSNFGNVAWTQYNYNNIELTVGTKYPAYFRDGASDAATGNGENMNLMTYVDGYQVFAQNSFATSRIMYYEVKVTVKSVASLPTASVSANSNWSDLSFSPSFTDGGDAKLNFTANSKVTANSAITVNQFTVDGTANASFDANSGSLAASNTTINRPTTIASGINLGAFSLGTNGSLTVDATSSAYSAASSMFASLRSNDVTFNGNGTNGANILLSSDKDTYDQNSISGHWVFSGGTHTLQKANESATLAFGTGATESNPTIYIKDGAKLTAIMRNPCGWTHTADVGGIIRIADASTLEWESFTGLTMYWAQRLYFEPGASMIVNTTGNDLFRLNGGHAKDNAQLYMPSSSAGSAAAVISAKNNTSRIFLADNSGYTDVAANIGANSTLQISAPIYSNNHAFYKYGTGTLYITGTQTSPHYVIEEGTLKTSVNLNENTEIKSGGTLAIVGGASDPLTFTMPSATNNNGSTTIASGIVRITAGTEGTMSVATGATLQLQVTDVQIASGYDASAITGSGAVEFVNSAGTKITDNVSGKVLSPAVNIWTASTSGNTFSTATRWSLGTVPAEGDNVGIKITDDTTMGIDLSTALSLGTITVSGTAGKTLTLQLEGEYTTVLSATSITPQAGVNVKIVSGISATSIVALAGTTITYDPSSEITVASTISGDGAVVIASGTVTFGQSNTFKGGLTVKSGAIAKTAQNKSEGFGYTANSSTLSQLGQVTVENGGAVDLNNTKDHCYKFTIAGTGVNNSGALYNNSQAMDTGARQTTSITLSDDATIVGSVEWGLLASGHNATVLNLAGHTLTKKGTGNFLIVNAGVGGATSGKIVVDGGQIRFSDNGSNTSVNFSVYDVEFVNGGTLTAEKSCSFKTIKACAGSTVDFNNYVSVSTSASTEGTGKIQFANYSSTSARTMDKPVTGNITKIGAGDVELSSVSNSITGASISAGKLKLNCAEKGIQGTIDIASGAKLEISRSDAFKYDGTCTVNVKGTLNMGNYRFSVGQNNTLNVYAGATVSGTGDGSGAIDNFKNVTYNFLALDGQTTVNWTANTRVREDLTLNVEEGVTVNHSGNFMRESTYNKTITKAGAGAFKLSGTNAGHTLKYEDGTFDMVTVADEVETTKIHVKQNEVLTVAEGYALTYAKTTWMPIYGIAGAGTLTKTGDANLSINTPDDEGTENGNFNIINGTTVNWGGGIMSLRAPGNRTSDDKQDNIGYLNNATINLTGGEIQHSGKVGIKGSCTINKTGGTVQSGYTVYLSGNDATLTMTNDCDITVKIEGAAEGEEPVVVEGDGVKTYSVGVHKADGSTDEAPIIAGKVTSADDVADNVEAGATSVDMSQATIGGETDIDAIKAAIDTKTGDTNTILIAPAGTETTSNKANVLVPTGEDNTYKSGNLQLTDVVLEKIGAKNFSDTKVTYTRAATTSQWGTICVPYVPAAEEGVSYYELTASTQTSLTFTKVTTLAANTPYMYKKTTGGEMEATNSSATFALGVTGTQDGSEVNTFKLVGIQKNSSIVDGTSIDEAKTGYEKIVDANAYYFKNTDNKFYTLNQRFSMKAFRCYLTTTSTLGARQSVLGFGYEEDGTTTGVSFVESNDGNSVEVVFDLGGRRQQNAQKGVNIINGKKVIK